MCLVNGPPNLCRGAWKGLLLGGICVIDVWVCGLFWVGRLANSRLGRFFDSYESPEVLRVLICAPIITPSFPQWLPTQTIMFGTYFLGGCCRLLIYIHMRFSICWLIQLHRIEIVFGFLRYACYFSFFYFGLFVLLPIAGSGRHHALGWGLVAVYLSRSSVVLASLSALARVSSPTCDRPGFWQGPAHLNHGAWDQLIRHWNDVCM